MFTTQAINEFKQIYLDEYGVSLSDQEATEKATLLLQLFEVLAGTKGLDTSPKGCSYEA